MMCVMGLVACRAVLGRRGAARARSLPRLQQAHQARAEHDRHCQRQVRPRLRPAHQRREYTVYTSYLFPSLSPFLAHNY